MVGRKPIHLLKEDERKKAAELKQLHIDIGAADGDEARGLVRVGDVAVIDGEPVELPNDRVVSRSLDNRLGCFVALEAARLVSEAGGAPGDVVAVAAAQEEITLGGAQTVAYRIEPAVAIAVDVTHATDVPGDRGARARLAPARLRPGDRPRVHAAPARVRAAPRRRRARGHRVHDRGLGAATRAPTRTRWR